MAKHRAKGKGRGRAMARQRVGDKIKVLRHEGVMRDRAIAMALSMERAGRLRKGGRYVRARAQVRGRDRR